MRTQKMDPSRLVNPASGWYDAPVGDVIDVHDYVEVRSPRPTWTRAAVLGEYGGLGHKVCQPCSWPLLRPVFRPVIMHTGHAPA